MDGLAGLQLWCTLGAGDPFVGENENEMLFMPEPPMSDVFMTERVSNLVLG